MVEVSVLNGLAVEIAQLTLDKRAKEAEVKELTKKIGEVEAKLIPLLVEEQRDSWEIPELGKLSLRVSTNWNIQDQEALVNYLLDYNKAMVKMHPQSIKGWASEQLEQNPNWNSSEIGLVPYEQIKTSFRRK